MTPIDDSEIENDNTKKSNAKKNLTAKQTENNAVAEQKNNEDTSKKQAFMYLGPNIPGGVLFTGSVHKVIPVYLKDVFEGIPELKELFIEVKDVPAYKRELAQQGSEAYRLRQNVEILIGKGAHKNVRV